MLARIFRPAKTAMQSGMGQTDLWVLEYEPEVPLKIDPLMGYTSSSDMRQQIRLEFATSAEFYPALIETYKALIPLIRFLNDPLSRAQTIPTR